MSLPTILTPKYTGPPHLRSKAPISLPPPLPAAQTAPFEDDKQWKLFVTTSTKVTVWDAEGCNVVFTSGSEGIVAAKRAKDGSVLAIADSQVVMLHRIEEGQDKSYRLKGTQRCRHLQYDHDSRSLFFTDSIHNSVQSYSLKENRVVDAAKPHPSQITAFAVSSDSNLVLSCSADPPIIQVHNRLIAATISIAPRSSSKPVVNCSFHPNRKNIFVLAFGDGVLAAYDYSKISGGSKAKKDGKVGVGHGGTREIHAFQHLHDPSIVGSSGITGVQFVPGYRSRAVTVGEDGRLFLVDFDMRDTLGSWHISAPATSLTIRPIIPKEKVLQKDYMGGCVIAVGTIHGKCYVYDGNGNKIGEQLVDVEGGKVLDVEWVSGDIHLPPSMKNNVRGSGSSLSHAKSFPSTEGQQAAANLRHSVTAESLKPSKATAESAKPRLNAEIDFEWTEAKEAASQGYMNLFSPVKRKPKKPEKAVSLVASKSPDTDKVSDPRLRTSEKEDQRSVISAPLLWNETTAKHTQGKETKGEEHEQADKSLVDSQEDTIIFSAGQRMPSQSNVLPSLGHSTRSSDSDSLLALHRISSVTSDTIKTCDKTNDGKLLSQIRSVRAKIEGDKAARGNLSIFGPYMSNKIKTSAMVRSGSAIENHKVSSLPQEKVIDPKLQVLDRNRIEERVDGSRDEIDRRSREELGVALVAKEGVGKGGEEGKEGEEMELSSREEAVESDASFEDIWLVEEKPPKSRKRKNFLPPDDLPSSSANSGGGDRSSGTASRAGSSKSRKTVSWDGRLDIRNSPGHSHLAHGMEPPSSPRFNVSSEHSSPSINATGTNTGISLVSNVISLATPTRELDNANNRYSSGTDSWGGYSFHVPKELAPSKTGRVSELDPALKNALMKMQMGLKLEMRNMQAEIRREFQAQRNAFEDLKSEIQIVRLENRNLRNQLSDLNGAREED
ncbi:hypothetical protein Q9L58_003427 [Maublancomyces gigas]|uniref:WD40 repeat-like protein n=1 Tax=Discina gigas TaxID=1032678 RepID=A0ABR3GNX0_9PEZI